MSVFPVHIAAMNQAAGVTENQYVLDAITYANANTITVPPTGYVNALHTMFNTIQAYNGGSLLTNADIIRVYAYDGSANEFATINLARNAFHATIVNSPVFTAKKGVKPDGVNGYLDSGYSPSVNTINLGDDSVMHFAYYPEITTTNTAFSWGVRGGNSSTIASAPARSTTVMDVPCLSSSVEGRSTITGATVAGSRGALVNGTTTLTPYKNGVAQSNLTITDFPLPNGIIYEAGYNNNGTLAATATDAFLGMLYLGAPDASGQLVLHNAFAQYLTDIAGL